MIKAHNKITKAKRKMKIENTRINTNSKYD